VLIRAEEVEQLQVEFLGRLTNQAGEPISGELPFSFSTVLRQFHREPKIYEVINAALQASSLPRRFLPLVTLPNFLHWTRRSKTVTYSA
jgi:hypothetical protein